MGGLNYFIISSTFIQDATIMTGLPIGFWPVGSTFLNSGQAYTPPAFSWLAFILDIIFWYFIACMAIAWYKHEKRLNIAAYIASLAITVLVIIFLYTNLVTGSWGIMVNPVYSMILSLIILGIYILIIKKTKAFGLRKPKA